MPLEMNEPWNPTEKDLKKLDALGASQCTIEEIAATLGISKTTIYKYKGLDKDFADAIKKAQVKGRAFVKGSLMAAIQGGSVSAMVFYLKTQCGWKEKIEISGEIKHTAVIAPPVVEKDEWHKLTQNPSQVMLGLPNQDRKHS